MSATRYRAFNEEFRVYLEQRGGWPRKKAFEAWMQAKHSGYAGGTLTSMRAGKPVAEKYIHGFVEMLIHHPMDVSMRQSRIAVGDFLRARGFVSLTDETAEAAIGHFCGPLTDVPPDDEPTADYLMRGLRLFGDYLHALPIERTIKACQKDEDVAEAIHWMFQRVGQTVSPKGDLLAEQAAVAFAEQYMVISESAYTKKAIAWARENPWTVTRAWHKRGGVGMTICLPLSDTAYERVLNGEMASYECEPGDLRVPSLNLILEAAGENYSVLKKGSINASFRMWMSILLQISALARVERQREAATLRMVSFAGTPKNRERLISSGFAPTGKRMKHTDVEIVERRLAIGKGANLVDGSVLSFLSGFCGSAPPI